MVATQRSEPTEAVFPLVLGDATTLRASPPEGTDRMGWLAFEMNRAGTVAGLGIVLGRERRERGALSLRVGTGPYGAFLWPPALDATEDTGDGMAALILAVRAGDESAFLEAASEIDWLRRPSADYERAVRLALAAGAHQLARRLADQGAERYPEDPVLKKMARILAPPRVVKTRSSSTTSVQANQAWLRTHADEYRGQWVALRDGELLASAETVKELRERLDDRGGIMLTRVF